MIRLILVLYILVGPISFAKNSLIFYTTEEYPYQSKRNTGATYEIIKGMYKKDKHLKPKIIFYPWKRSFNTVKKSKNTAIFTMARKKEREALFDWCCELYRAPRNEVFTVRGLGLHSVKKLKGKTGAVWRGDTSEIIIDSLIKKDKSIKKLLLNTPTQVIKMLLKKRVDFIVIKEPLIMDSCYKDKLNCRDIIHIDSDFNSTKNNLYIALNLKTDPKLKKDFVNRFNRFKKLPDYLHILKKYGLDD